MDNNQALHEAIANNDMERFLNLLSQPGVDLNCEYGRHTPLLESLRQDNPVMAKRLIEAGCDVHLKNSLHHVIDLMYSPYLRYRGHCRSQYRSLAQMLIQKGANINQKSVFHSETPLHTVIRNNDLEAVSMLLYYGADVNITNKENRTPLMTLLSTTDDHGEAIYEVLINYYDDFSCRDKYGNTAIHFAARHQLRFTIDLFNRGACINCVDNRGNSVLRYTLWQKNAELFKFVWSKIDHNILVACCEPFLKTYLRDCRFSDSGYFECLYLMLESPIAQFLIEHYRNRPSWKNKYSLYD